MAHQLQGRAALYWKLEPDADMNHVFMSTSNDPFNWQLIGATTKSRSNADSLEPGDVLLVRRERPGCRRR